MSSRKDDRSTPACSGLPQLSFFPSTRPNSICATRSPPDHAAVGPAEGVAHIQLRRRPRPAATDPDDAPGLRAEGPGTQHRRIGFQEVLGDRTGIEVRNSSFEFRPIQGESATSVLPSQPSPFPDPREPRPFCRGGPGTWVNSNFVGVGFESPNARLPNRSTSLNISLPNR